MSGVPIRLRVAAAVAVAIAMALVLAGAGLLIYDRVGEDLSRALDQDLRLRAQDVSALVRDTHGSLAADSGTRLIERGESFAQLLDERGHVLDATRYLGGVPLLSALEVVAASRRDRFFDRRSVPGLDEPARLLAVPVDRGGQRDVVVTGATRENRAEALRSLRTELMIVGPLALVLATVLGYVLAGAGLRTVEAMRSRAADISADRPGDRLPVPPTGDELQHLGETLNAMLARLEQALERERNFVAEAGHELRTPLGLVRAELDYALHYAENDDELRDALRTASQETDRLVQLAGDLLLLAGSEQGRLRLRVESVPARELMESVRRRFAWRAEAEHRRIEIEATPEEIVTGDRVRLEQALGNLLDNALRHGAGLVTIRARPVDRAVELDVRDEGNGFPPQFLARAFQRFARADDSRTGQGAGLGLAIVSTIAQAHSGTASARNSADGGADVTIRLPLRTVPAPASGSTQARGPTSSGASTTGPR